MNSASSSAAGQPLPPNVPTSLVRPYPFMMGQVTTDNPYETLIPRIHEGPEVFYTPDGYHGIHSMWVFRKYRDIDTIYQDTEHFSAKDFAPFAKLVGETWNLVPAETDPPLHGARRHILNPLFAPKRMVGLEPRVREIARNAIAKFRDRGQCDFMAQMAFEFPIIVFLELMGLPVENVSEFLSWERKLTHPDTLEEAKQGTIAVVGYLREVIAERKKNPTDDFISYGIKAEIEGHKLTDDELVGFCFNLFIGGLDTVSTNMGWHFRHLAEHPVQQEQLRRNPSLIPSAIEEMLRAYSAVTTQRHCVKATRINGVDIVPGDICALSTPLANRDPEVFEDPGKVDFNRHPRHLTFATGIHRCVGAPLARRELVIALEEVLSAIPSFGIEPGAQVKTAVGAIIQPMALPLVWNRMAT